MKRRRFLAITAAVGALAAHPARAFALDPVEWRGVALGAAARLTIHHEDRAEALRLLDSCLAEVERLERIFSLYRPDSSLSQLNRTGRLEAPPLEMLVLLGQVDRVWRLSEGIFDPTVQPLWEAYARHFSVPGASPSGPAAEVLEQLRPAVDWTRVSVSEDVIFFSRANMGMTLNGIAQGYITDRVIDLLHRGGIRHVLADMGEIRALGPQWRVTVPGRGTLPVQQQALATSAADGTRFSPACHHLFDPRSCRSSVSQQPVTVIAPTAAIADAVSTACAVAPRLSNNVFDALDCRVV
ncbi:MAG: FAD:protein FMN transferase [Rhodospirillaceae bacterium]|nr:FAD:protein FMN transferase [Rhodospirillales bacterium]